MRVDIAVEILGLDREPNEEVEVSDSNIAEDESREPAGQTGPRAVIPAVTRRGILTGAGLAGIVGAVAAYGPTSQAYADDITADVHPLTIEGLRSSTEADLQRMYYVTDPGREGMFRFAPDDTTSVDDNGIVFVNNSGHRFYRIFDGPIRIEWFGAIADYDSVSGTGTPNDDALEDALAALEPYARRLRENGGFREGTPTIAFDAGNYLFTRKQFTPQWYSAIRGLRLAGEGMYITNLWFDCPEEENGTDNYFLINDNRLWGMSMSGIAFYGVSGTERFMYIRSTGTAGKSYFTECAWHKWRIGFDIVEARANADLNMFKFCRVRSMPAGSVFFNVNNPQSVIHSFVDCDFHSDGTIFKFLAGGILTVLGGSYTTFNDGCLLHIEDPSGSGVGVGNGQYVLNGVKPEIRQASQLVRMNAPEANVIFADCQLIIGQSNFSATWAAEKQFAEGSRSRVGAKSPSMGRSFRCLASHTASEASRPLTGADWKEYWEPLHEIDIEAGALQIRGGAFAYVSRLRYDDESYRGARDRARLTLSDGCSLVNPIADTVDFVPIGDVGNDASLPRVIVDGCQPYTGAATNAYWATPTDPVDVALNVRHGFDGNAVPVKTFLYTANPQRGAGLPAAADGECMFRLPRGAEVISMQLIARGSIDAADYQVTNHDGSVTFLSPRNRIAPLVDSWYPITSEAERTFIFTSKAATVADGCLRVEYI